MKVRLGFVSNSSTSSFVIVGFRYDDCPNIEIGITYKAYEKGFVILDGEDDGIKKGQIVVGKTIAHFDEEDGTVDINRQELEAIAKEIKEFFNIPEDKEWKIYTGMRYS